MTTAAYNEIRWSFASEANTVLPPVPWLVPALQLRPGRTSLLVGAKESCKTLLATSIAISVAAGLPVFGALPARAATVAILDYEIGRAATLRRVVRLARGLGVDLAALGRRLRWVSFPPLNLGNRRDELFAALEGVDLVIVDSFRRAIPGSVDENESRVGEYVDSCSRWSDATQGTALVLHHTGKDPTSPRGSSAIDDAAGAMWLAQRKAGKQLTVRLTCRKPHPEATGAAPTLTIAVEDMPEDAVRLVLVGGDERAAQILAAVGKKPELTKEEIREATGIRRGDCYRLVDALVENRALVAGTGRGGGHTYSAPKDRQPGDTPEAEE